MKRMTTADVGKEGKTADWTRASASTSVQRTLTVPSSGDTWEHLTLGQPAQARPSSSDSEIQPVLNTPTCHPIGHLVFSMPPGTLSMFSKPSSGLPASPRGWRPAVCHTHGQRLPPWCHRLGQLGGGTAPWFILFPWVTNVPALPCPAEAARGDDMGRPCSLDDLLQQRWGSPQTPRPTRVNLPAGPRRSCPPLSSSHFSWLPARSLLDLLPPRCQGALQFYM